jgi:hypothetical protein
MFLAPTRMTKTHKRLTKKEVAVRVDAAYRDLLEGTGFKFDPDEMNRVLNSSNVSPHKRVAKGLSLGMALGVLSWGRTASREIRTEAQLDKVLLKLREAKEQLPTLARKAAKEVLSKLPRRGGPGRTPKLNARESSMVCDQIGVFIRQKNTLKESLAKTAELTLTLLGKKVSARTLQKAWDKRDQFIGNTK